MKIEEIIEIIKEELETEGKEITKKTRIIEDLGADSLDKIEVMSIIGEKLNVDFVEEEIKKISTVEDIYNYIEKYKK